MRNKSIMKIFFKKDIFIYFLLSIEIMISIFLVYNIQKELVIKSKIDKLDEYYWNAENSFSISLNPLDFNSDIDDSLNKFYKELSDIKGIDNKGLIYNDYLFTDTLKIDYSDKIHINFSGFGTSLANNFGDNSGVNGIPIRFVSYDYISPLNLEYTNGSIDKNNLDSNSIILGNKFKKYYNIGEKIKLNENEYIIKAFVKKDTPFRFDKDYYEVNPFIDDSAIIILTDDIIKSENTLKSIGLMGGIQVSISKKNKSEDTIEEINNLADKNNLELTLINNKDSYEGRISEAKATTEYAIFRSFIFLSISIISLSVIMLYSIYDSKKNIGIAMLVGAKQKDIAIMVCLKIFFISILSFVGATIMSNYINIAGSGYFDIKTSYNMIMNSFIVTLAFIIITLIIPIRKILCIDIKSLVGGER